MSGAKQSPLVEAEGPSSMCQPEGASTDTMGGGLLEGHRACEGVGGDTERVPRFHCAAESFPECICTSCSYITVSCLSITFKNAVI